jgi:hypothetical protein
MPRKFWDIYAHLKIFQSNIVFCPESSGTLTNSQSNIILCPESSGTSFTDKENHR